jgi:hypothetical protein
MLKVYIFSYAIIKELIIYYNINFFFFQEQGIALGQPIAHLLIGTFALPKWCLEGIEPPI